MTAVDFQARRLRTLMAEIDADLAAVSELASEVATLRVRMESGSDTAIHAALALRIEHFYTAVEAVLLRVAKVVDGDAPEGDNWHQHLLRQASLAVEGLRPACLSAETVALLRPLMAFRHFLRHAYAIHLEPRRLADRATEVIRAAPLAIRDLRAFSEFLGQVVESYYGQ